MGEMWWLRRVYQIANCGSPRVEVQAAKLAGLALGAFDEPLPSAGAKVIINPAADGGRAAVQVSIEGQRASPAESGTLTFATTKTNRRRRASRNLS